MKKLIVITISLIFGTLLTTGRLQAQDNQKLAQSGMKFMNATLDARTAGLGDAVTALDGNAAFLFSNPAGVARQENFLNATAGTMNWIADIKYMFGAVTFAPSGGDFGIIGVSAMSVNYGDFIETIPASNTQGYYELGTFRPYAFSFGVSYAKALNDKLALGGSIKYAKQSLGAAVNGVDANNNYTKKDNVQGVLAFDFGLLYRTGFRSLNFAMSVKNFSQETKFEKENFQLPLTFRIGLSFNAMDLMENVDKNMHSFLLSVDAIHYRDFPEQLSIGGEYTFMNTLSLRAGYNYPADERSYTVGVGVKQSYQNYGLGVDYSYTPYGVFNSVHRVNVNVSL
ncbi:MAG TPA: PorV/PorQ family protein [Ignavibacteriales bacterium]|nr:PorV/PorQ family protein [Ignavibacteriales bacterium]